VSTWAASSMAIWNQVALCIRNSCDHAVDRGDCTAISGDSFSSGEEEGAEDGEDEEGWGALAGLWFSRPKSACMKKEIASPSEPHTKNGNCHCITARGSSTSGDIK
jgi:hypothetical protein